MLASELFLMTGLEKSPIHSSSRRQVDFLAERATLKLTCPMVKLRVQAKHPDSYKLIN